MKGIEEIEEKTCVKFRQGQDASGNYVEVFKDGGCYSLLGRVGRGRQPLSLSNGCIQQGVIVHEFMHALGFHHEQVGLLKTQFQGEPIYHSQIDNLSKNLVRGKVCLD